MNISGGKYWKIRAEGRVAGQQEALPPCWELQPERLNTGVSKGHEEPSPKEAESSAYSESMRLSYDNSSSSEKGWFCPFPSL